MSFSVCNSLLQLSNHLQDLLLQEIQKQIYQNSKGKNFFYEQPLVVPGSISYFYQRYVTQEHHYNSVFTLEPIYESVVSDSSFNSTQDPQFPFNNHTMSFDNAQIHIQVTSERGFEYERVYKNISPSNFSDHKVVNST